LLATNYRWTSKKLLVNLMNAKSINLNNKHVNQILDILHENITRSNEIHQEFLHSQNLNLQMLFTGYRKPLQIREPYPSQQVLINKHQMEEFGTGSIAKCFGPEFKKLDQRKSPRIPNGDLLMIDRVLTISGERGNLKPPASIVTEYDIPDYSWFINENHYSGIPLGILMEIALQPCGILSAYLGTSLILPVDVNLFRNLDGEISFKAHLPISGETITNHATLLSSVFGGGMLIQKYKFELFVNGSMFLHGSSSFGYFTQAVMEKQSGIDATEFNFSISDDFQKLETDRFIPSKNISSKRHLDLIDNLSFKNEGGKFELGVILGEKIVNNSEWFYSNHFFQDPVMPGSLGVEAITQSLWLYARNVFEDKYFKDPIVEFSSTNSLSWKYRGQVTPKNKILNFEIHLKNKDFSASSILLLADADFWVDGKKIYTVQNISMTIRKGNI
jgi:3-hydroxymyristoyl/3-hydroxydecanoyl-(acyl carrier protein) dehydratase